jgi:hypothetical protein
MPKRGPKEEEPFSPIDAHMVDALLRPESRTQEKERATAYPRHSAPAEVEGLDRSDKIISIPAKKRTPQKERAAQSSAMKAGWKISTSPEDKRAITAFVRELNDTLGEDSNIGISNLGRALYMMILKRKEEVFRVAQGRRFIRPDNNDHVALALLEESLGDLIAEACFNSQRAEYRDRN